MMPMFETKVRLLMMPPEQFVPFYIESIGYNPFQETVIRRDGYPFHHWLQSVSGEGKIVIEGSAFSLPPNHGIMLPPNVPHQYYCLGDSWSTYYLMIDGPQISPFISILDIQFSTVYSWPEGTEPENLIGQMLESSLLSQDVTGLDNSIDVYRFLVQLKKHGTTVNTSTTQSLAVRLQPLVQYLDIEYRNPDLGMTEMSDRLNISPRHLNSLFKETFGYTPYQYLINLRIQKSKEMLTSERKTPIQHIAASSGFRDASHFIATFRKLEHMTPDQYRQTFVK